MQRGSGVQTWPKLHRRCWAVGFLRRGKGCLGGEGIDGFGLWGLEVLPLLSPHFLGEGNTWFSFLPVGFMLASLGSHTFGPLVAVGRLCSLPVWADVAFQSFTMSADGTTVLSTEDVRFFHENGFLLKPGFATSMVGALIQAAEEVRDTPQPEVYILLGSFLFLFTSNPRAYVKVRCLLLRLKG